MHKDESGIEALVKHTRNVYGGRRRVNKSVRRSARAKLRQRGGKCEMDTERLASHIKLCRRNLKNRRVKCCANCPFEEEIVSVYPEMRTAFVVKRALLASAKFLTAEKRLRPESKPQHGKTQEVPEDAS